MKIHHYNAETGEFISEGKAENDPLQGLPMMPANAVAVAPPVTGANQAAKWSGAGWEAVPDHRGEFGYDAAGQRQEITEINIIPDVTWTATPPPAPAPTAGEQLAATDAGMIRTIEDLTNVLIAKGVIIKTDLPAFTVEKLDNRKALRAKL